jgi:cytochrome c oxidase assembly factor CtaG
VLGGTFVSWGLAVAIGYASHPLYAYPTPTGGFSLLADQEIAAGVMWVPGSVPFLIALLYLGIVWFEVEERRSSALVAPHP